jgi:A/G-specific adenine glycosylase
VTRFSQRLLDWWGTHGRHDLPWQTDRTPYRVWVSEIMLQQTQVSTVIGYFDQFMATFPTLEALARAPIDDVLALWSGLGYYARARNLHKAAQICVEQHRGALPNNPDALQQLPGIGRSTANAIVAQAHDRRAVILDGNVKRVLTRYCGIDGWPGKPAVEKALWSVADTLTPAKRATDYTQAIMDLGAMVCTRHRPHCGQCPVANDCRAFIERKTDQWPTPRPKTQKQHIAMTLAVCRNHDRKILLEKRPASGIWGGLWCLPTAEVLPEFSNPRPGPELARMHHELTHRSLLIDFKSVWVDGDDDIPPTTQWRWIDLANAQALALPRPIQKALAQLATLEN